MKASKKLSRLAHQVVTGQYILWHKGEYFVRTSELGYKDEYSFLCDLYHGESCYTRIFRNTSRDRLLFVKGTYPGDVKKVPSFNWGRAHCYIPYNYTPVEVLKCKDTDIDQSETDSKKCLKLLREKGMTWHSISSNGDTHTLFLYKKGEYHKIVGKPNFRAITFKANSLIDLAIFLHQRKVPAKWEVAWKAREVIINNL